MRALTGAQLTHPPGTVFKYPYLWLRHQQAGRTDGEKDRTSCMVRQIEGREEDGQRFQTLVILAITEKPDDGKPRIEISKEEKQLAGLDVARPAYLVLYEFNEDMLPYSVDFNPRAPAMGRFSPAFTNIVEQSFDLVRKMGLSAIIERVQEEDRQYAKGLGR